MKLEIGSEQVDFKPNIEKESHHGLVEMTESGRRKIKIML